MLRIKLSIIFSALVVCVSCTSQLGTSSSKNYLAKEQTAEVRSQYESTGEKFVVATQGQAASAAALSIMQQGGNLIDAAVAASFVISVERPQSTGLGGGGFLLYREAKTGKVYAVDFRERAPLKAYKDMFLNSENEVVAGRSTEGILAAAVPGLVAGLLEIQQEWGQLPRQKILKPAIDLAEKGFAIYPSLAEALEKKQKVLATFPATAKIFLDAKKKPLQQGAKLQQKDLSQTLQVIAKGGVKSFYQGTLAEKIVQESAKRKGLITLEDLRRYEVKWRDPVQGTYKGYQVYGMPPPSSGGTHVLQILGMLEKDSLGSLDLTSRIHLLATAMQRAFADRARYMGDPDFVNIPLQGLLSKTYHSLLRSQFNLSKATPSENISYANLQEYNLPPESPAGPESIVLPESTETTNFSMMDMDGNVVVSTQTINGFFGSGIVVPGTGILLNNEMDDFSAKPGASNLFGAIGSEANSVEPLKTPLSSMSPTIVLKEGRPWMALGGPGGTRIITCVAQTLINYLDLQMPLYESVATLRIHHQWKPDQLDLESPGFGSTVTERLTRMGHSIRIDRVPCVVNAVAREKGLLRAVADPRDWGSSLGL